VGLVLTYKTSGVFNFAIGAQAAASAYVFYSLRVQHHWPWPLAALATLVGVSLLSTLILERLAFWLGEAPAVMRVVATIGLLVLLESMLTAAYGAATIPFNPFLPTSHFRIAGVNVGADQVIVVALALSVTVCLYVFFKKFRLGIAMQAVVEDSALLALGANDPVRVRRVAWAIGSAFVSISGILVAPLIGIDVNSMILLYITAFGAAAIGAFSNLPATFAAAVGIGVAMNIAADKLASQSNVVLAELYTQIPFLVLVLALLVLPKSRFVERGIRQARRLAPVVPYSRRVGVTGSAVGLALAVAAPWLVGASKIDQWSSGLSFVVIFASLALLLWTSGQISLCQMAFAAIGATTFAHALQAGIPWLIALLLAAAIAVPVGALLAVPSFRLSGVYLAVATFGFGLLLQNLAYTTFLMFGLSDTLKVSRPHLFGLGTYTDRGYYYVTLVAAVGCLIAVVLTRRSRLGRLLRGLADAPAALQAHGVDTRYTRMFVFCISAVIASIGGALLGGVTQSAGGTATGPFGYFNSLAIVAVLAFCGRRTVVSPVVAAIVFEVLKVYKPFSDTGFQKYEGVGFGLLAIAVAVAPALTLPRNGKRLAARARSGPAMERFNFVPKDVAA
jgi:branched-subunit amino acid ABC-type transport system permease component